MRLEISVMDSPLPRFTYSDLQGLDSDTNWELIDGIPYAMAGASWLHQAIVGELFVALKLQFKGGKCQVLFAPFDVKFSELDVVQPDLLVSCSNRLHRQFHEGAPDLVVEILSPSTQRHDRIRKLNLYARAGVPEYWLVHQHPFFIEVLQNQSGVFAHRGGYDKMLLSQQFPELKLDLDEIRANLPEQPPIVDEVREGRPPVYTA